jgi:hypothetical protein
MLIMNSHYLVDCHFFAWFCLDNSGAFTHDVHRIPYSQRNASWVSIAIWISTFWPTTMLCSSFWGHWNFNFFKYQYKTNQARIKIQVSSQETLDPCSVQYWGKFLGPHSLSLSSWPVCTWHKIIKLILLWRRLGRGGLLRNSHFMGSGCGRTPTSSLLRKSFTWSVFDVSRLERYCTNVLLACLTKVRH